MYKFLLGFVVIAGLFFTAAGCALLVHNLAVGESISRLILNLVTIVCGASLLGQAYLYTRSDDE